MSSKWIWTPSCFAYSLPGNLTTNILCFQTYPKSTPAPIALPHSLPPSPESICPSISQCWQQGLTLLPSSMTTTSCWAYSWISVSQAWRRKESTEWWGNPKLWRREGRAESAEDVGSDREEGLESDSDDRWDGWIHEEQGMEKDSFILASLSSLRSPPSI